MSLRHAILTSLLDGDASGYELAKRFDATVADFWHALPAQLYPELTRLAADGLVDATEVPQDRRPTKRVFAINDDGRAELRRWVAEPSRPFSLKDEFMVKLCSAADTDPGPAIDALQVRRARCVAKLDGYRAVVAGMLRDRSETTFLRTAHRIGPYLAANAGIALEQSQLTWIDDTIAILGRAATSPSSAPGTSRRGTRP